MTQHYSLGIKSRYVPIDPTPKQAVALSPVVERIPEVFYGGSAGGGKSEWLLAAALRYVDVPRYSAILFRLTFQELKLPEALMDRAAMWLSGTDARWNSQDKRWTFPGSASLSFGYMEHEKD